MEHNITGRNIGILVIAEASTQPHAQAPGTPRGKSVVPPSAQKAAAKLEQNPMDLLVLQGELGLT